MWRAAGSYALADCFVFVLQKGCENSVFVGSKLVIGSRGQVIKFLSYLVSAYFTVFNASFICKKTIRKLLTVAPRYALKKYARQNCKHECFTLKIKSAIPNM